MTPKHLRTRLARFHTRYVNESREMWLEFGLPYGIPIFILLGMLKACVDGTR